MPIDITSLKISNVIWTYQYSTENIIRFAIDDSIPDDITVTFNTPQNSRYYGPTLNEFIGLVHSYLKISRNTKLNWDMCLYGCNSDTYHKLVEGFDESTNV